MYMRTCVRRFFALAYQIYGWRPDFYNTTENLPEKMPLDLKEHIASLKGNNSLQLNTIWVSCEGENPADQENIGPISYLPRRGFPGYFYPYENSEGYLSPLVAVHFVRPRSKSCMMRPRHVTCFFEIISRKLKCSAM